MSGSDTNALVSSFMAKVSVMEQIGYMFIEVVNSSKCDVYAMSSLSSVNGGSFFTTDNIPTTATTTPSDATAAVGTVPGVVASVVVSVRHPLSPIILAGGSSVCIIHRSSATPTNISLQLTVIDSSGVHAVSFGYLVDAGYYVKVGTNASVSSGKDSKTPYTIDRIVGISKLGVSYGERNWKVTLIPTAADDLLKEKNLAI